MEEGEIRHALTNIAGIRSLAAAARRGILIKGGVYLEEARKLRVVALDKTSTITEGKPKLVATEILPSKIPEAQVLRWAADLAGHSNHPVSWHNCTHSAWCRSC